MTSTTRWMRRRWVWLALVAALVVGGSSTSAMLLSGGSQSASGSTGTTSTTAAAPSVNAGKGGTSSAPPTPTITSGPADPTLATTATFTYADTLPPATFKCSLDSGPYAGCGGGPAKPPNTGTTTYTRLLPQRHCFAVEALVGSQTSSPATQCWQQNGLPFTMHWTAPADFYPGTSQSADLTVSNPNPKAITIPKSDDPGGLVVTVTSNDPTACPSSDFGLAQGLTIAATVPANTSGATLSSLGVPAADLPVVTMYDGSGGAGSHTNQNLCRGVGLTFTFAATAAGI